MKTLKVLATAAVLGLSGQAAQAADTIDLWHVFNLESDIIYKGIEEFNASQDEYVVEPRLIPSNQFVAELARAVATQSVPDVVTLNDPYVATFSAAGALTDLTDMIAESEYIDLGLYYPGPQATSTWEGRSYTIPRDTNTLALYYNADMFREAGLDPEKPPRTWSELKDYAAALTKDGVYGFGFSAAMASDGPFQWLPYLYQAGGKISDLTAPEAQEALQLWVDLLDAGLVSRDVINQRQYEVANVFKAGGAAMVMGGPWELPKMETDAGFEWRTALLPVHDTVGVPASTLGGYHYAIPAGADEVEGAFAFLEFMSNPVMLNANWGAGRLAPRTDVVIEDPKWPGAYAAFRKQLESAQQRGPHPEWPKIERALNIAIQQAMTGSESVEDALAEAAATIDPILAETPL